MGIVAFEEKPYVKSKVERIGNPDYSAMMKNSLAMENSHHFQLKTLSSEVHP
jgi:hypothetical protein